MNGPTLCRIMSFASALVEDLEPWSSVTMCLTRWVVTGYVGCLSTANQPKFDIEWYRTCPPTMTPVLRIVKVSTRKLLPSCHRINIMLITSCASEPMGVYTVDGQRSTYTQGQSPTPPPHPAPSSSNCQALPTVSSSPVQARRALDRKFVPKFPEHTPAPSYF